MSNQVQLSIDEQAARMAETMLAKSGGAGALPESQKEAEGGFTADAGGTLINAGQKGSEAMKSQKTGSKMNTEPGREGRAPLVTSAITDEPDRQEAGGGSDGNLDTDADGMARKRKSGQVGVGGGLAAKQNLSEHEDGKARSRKTGHVGFGKSEDADEDDKDDKDEGKGKPPWKKGTRLAPDATAKACKKSDDEDEDDEGEDEDEGEDSEKSMVDVDDLMKSLDTLEAIAGGASIPVERDRRAELAEKLAAGTLNKSELGELHDLTKSELEEPMADETVDALAKSYQEQFAEDPTMAEGYDVSPFLERQSQLLAASMDQLQERMIKSLEGSHANVQAFNGALAKSLRGMADLTRRQSQLIKSLSERLETVENTPMPRKGHSSVRTLSKSMAGEVGGSEGGPNRAQIFDALETMAKSQDYAPCGIKLTDAVAQFESTGQIPRSLMQDVVQQIRGNGVR